MSDFRLARLQSDYEAVKRLVHLHPRIQVEGVSGNPPDRYRLLLKVRSLREQAERVILIREHRLEITLPRTYPRDAPVCRMLTPVFHPNIAPHTICIGDHWSAAERLDSMIQRIGEMLAFQSYNVKSPLNGQAARWVEEHLHRLPIDKEEFFLDLADAEKHESKTGQCTNCGQSRPPLTPCGVGHFLCADCVGRCPTCGTLLCLSCGTTTCSKCAPAKTAAPAASPSPTQPAPPAPAPSAPAPAVPRPTAPRPTAASAPAHAGWVCANCGNRDTQARRCAAGHILCSQCILRCETCGRGLCVLCGQYPCQTCARAG